MPSTWGRCKVCGHRKADGWHISKSGLCRICAVARSAALTDATFPPDPVTCGESCHMNVPVDQMLYLA